MVLIESIGPHSQHLSCHQAFESAALPGSHSMSQGGPSLGNPGVVPFKIADVLSAEPAHPLMAVPAVAYVHPQVGSLIMAGHTCACPLIGLLVMVTRLTQAFLWWWQQSLSA